MPVNRDKMPELCFIGPGKRKAPFQHALFRVLSKHEDGTPKECVRIRDDETVEVEEGMEFMTAYLPKVMLQPRT